MSETASAPLVSFYGDDFTGSTDVMEALTLAGVDTVLFLRPPHERELAMFPGTRAFGVAGIARTMSPEQMEKELPPIFEALRAAGALMFHYKICSTFDSSPSVGSIGRGAEIAREVFGADLVPIVVGAPPLRRYQVFGNLFAAADDAVYRLDRHPTMVGHPVTPMHESDLRLHLAKQTELRIDLVDRLTIAAGSIAVQARLAELQARGAQLVLLDVLTEEDLAAIGETLEAAQRQADSMVVVGSSGVEYALAAHWGRRGAGNQDAFTPSSRPRTQTLGVSGSRAPASDAQVAYALHNGFEGIPVDPVLVTTSEKAREALVRRTEELWAAGSDVLLHTPPKDDANPGPDRDALGRALGYVTSRIVRTLGVRRLVVAGGDTSGLVTRALDILALRMIAPVAPGAPLCTAVSDDPLVDGLEIALKGGQVGQPDYFVDVANRDGGDSDNITRKGKGQS